jgi:hypothetical protein
MLGAVSIGTKIAASGPWPEARGKIHLLRKEEVAEIRWSNTWPICGRENGLFFNRERHNQRNSFERGKNNRYDGSMW